jgi:hypothetical protein
MCICIECAVKHHDFREVSRTAGRRDGAVPAASFAEAWIDGKRHRLGRVRQFHVPCEQCKKVTSSLYLSEDE